MIGVLTTRGALPWLAAAVWAWVAAVALAASTGSPGTLLLVVPPAVAASIPLISVRARRARVIAGCVLAALVAWSFVGLTLLGLYFLPSAVLVAVGLVRADAGVGAVRATR